MLEFHHTGCLVHSLAESIESYKQLLGDGFSCSEYFKIAQQGVTVCLIYFNNNCYLELVEPFESNTILQKLLKKKMNFYHIGFRTKQLEKEVARLEQGNFRVVSYFNSEAFQGKKCAFLYNENLHLIELIEW